LYFFSLFKDRFPFFAAAFGPQKSRSSSKRECKGTTFFLSAKIFLTFLKKIPDQVGNDGGDKLEMTEGAGRDDGTGTSRNEGWIWPKNVIIKK
jgi:hypothetical protein